MSAEVDALRVRRFENGVDPDAGTAIAIEISPPGTLDPSQIEWRRDGIAVLNAISRGDTEVVTLFVPEGKLSAFEKSSSSTRPMPLTTISLPEEPLLSWKPKPGKRLGATGNYRPPSSSSFSSESWSPRKEWRTWCERQRSGGPRPGFSSSAEALARKPAGAWHFSWVFEPPGLDFSTRRSSLAPMPYRIAWPYPAARAKPGVSS